MVVTENRGDSRFQEDKGGVSFASKELRASKLKTKDYHLKWVARGISGAVGSLVRLFDPKTYSPSFGSIHNFQQLKNFKDRRYLFYWFHNATIVTGGAV